MKQKLLFKSAFFLLLLLNSWSALAQTLIWRDEFNQPKLDDNKWTREVGGTGNGNGELQYYTSGEQNVFIGSKTNPSDTGTLVIEARREPYGIAPENRQFTSGRINTSGKFNVKYGTIEARIKLPDLQNGLWPAFWMLGANYPADGWPRSGEIDILEAGFKGDWEQGIANKKVNATVHWHQDNYLELVPNAHEVGWYGNASATNDTIISGSLTDYHVYKLEWTPTQMKAYVDNIHFYTFDIPANDPNITEFSSNPYFLILNLAVGGGNFVGITDPAQITAPMPAQMLVDYVRVYSNEHTSSFDVAQLNRPSGTYGVFTETTPVSASLTDPNIQVWYNLAGATTAAYEGSGVLSFTAAAGDWFGMAVTAATAKNLQNFTDGMLRFHMKTSSSHPLSIGIGSTINGNTGGTQSKTVTLDPAVNDYGLVRDGQWHQVSIPLSLFGNIEFRSINTLLYVVGGAPAAPVTFALDNIYWQDGTKITPENGDFILYSDTRTGVDKFDFGIDGNFNVWEATLTAQPTTAAEGANALSFTHGNKGWFGAAILANNFHNLSAYENADAKLVFSLKTSDTATPFYIGMKSGTRDGEGQRWIAFEPGQSPYGFQRNGTWQVVEIPMSHFYESIDLMQVSQLFQILGTGNIADIAIDNIYFTGGKAARQEDDGTQNEVPVANAGESKTIALPTTSIVLIGSGTDSDGTIAAYAWTRVSGPNSPTLAGANTANLTASNLNVGTYVFRLTVTDNMGATGSDTVSVRVNPAVAQNLALRKPVKVSSQENAGLAGAQAVDGDAGTRWASAFTNAEWISVDLGQVYDISRIKISWEAAYGRDYKLQVSNNETSWTDVKAVTGNTSLVNDHTGLSVNARYVRMLGVTRGTAYGYSIYELEVYGGTNVAPQANAGSDQAIALPTNSVVLKGSGTDADGTIAAYAWAYVNGPSTPTLTGANAAEATVSGLVAGDYFFSLHVTDNSGASASDTVRVIVSDGVKSAKRGLGYGYHSMADMQAIDQGISWWYNWHHEPDAALKGTYPNSEVAYMPMVWGGNFDVETVVAGIPDGAQYLLGFNEPNFRDQANLTAQQAAALWPQLEEIARRKNLKIVGPAMNYCGNCVTEGQSDPIEYLDEFFAACQDCQVDYISIHWYACSGEALQWYIDRFKKYGKPIWMTEIACWEGSPTMEQQKAYMIEAVEIMENDPAIMKYAWFTGRSTGPNIDIFDSQSGQLTELGQLYISLPANNGDGNNNSNYQAVPGKIEAESFVTMQGVQTETTGDTGGGQNVGWIDAGDWMDYAVNVATAGSYQVSFRVASTAATGQVQLRSGTTVLATVNVPNTGGWQTWTTATAQVNLAAGKQTLRVYANAAPFNLNWIEFASATPVNLALNKPATASSTEGGAMLASAANDGNAATRWSSTFSDPQWIQIDLQAVYNLNRVVLNWEAASAKAYTIQVSSDGTSWATIHTDANGNGGIDNITLSGTGRYIRMHGTQRNTPYGYSLYEFEVYGTPTAGARLAGREAAELSGLTLYPMPVRDVLRISATELSIQELEIWDVSGKLMIRKTVQNTEDLHLDLSLLQKGLYILRYKSETGTGSRKIIKQ